VGKTNFAHFGPSQKKFFWRPWLQCKWTLTKRFTVSRSQRKFPMKARAPFASILKSFSSGAVGYTGLPQKCTFCHLLQLLLNWRINVVTIVNSTQMSLKWKFSPREISWCVDKCINESENFQQVKYLGVWINASYHNAYRIMHYTPRNVSVRPH